MVPVKPFLETLRTFNAAVKNETAAGARPPKRRLAYKIAKPTFYAFHRLVPGVTLTFGGLMIDERARVLEADGRVIPGLFAAGEGAGQAFFDDYIGGSALTNCLVIGRIAGRTGGGLTAPSTAGCAKAARGRGAWDGPAASRMSGQVHLLANQVGLSGQLENDGAGLVAQPHGCSEVGPGRRDRPCGMNVDRRPTRQPLAGPEN
jgi:hypothetical protein